jgi:hypothetical protein
MTIPKHLGDMRLREALETALTALRSLSTPTHGSAPLSAAIMLLEDVHSSLPLSENTEVIPAAQDTHHPVDTSAREPRVGRKGSLSLRTGVVAASAEIDALYNINEREQALESSAKFISRFGSVVDPSTYRIVNGVIRNAISIIAEINEGNPEQYWPNVEPLYDLLIKRAYTASRRVDAANTYMNMASTLLDASHSATGSSWAFWKAMDTYEHVVTLYISVKDASLQKIVRKALQTRWSEIPYETGDLFISACFALCQHIVAGRREKEAISLLFEVCCEFTEASDSALNNQSMPQDELRKMWEAELTIRRALLKWLGPKAHNAVYMDDFVGRIEEVEEMLLIDYRGQEADNGRL